MRTMLPFSIRLASRTGMELFSYSTRPVSRTAEILSKLMSVTRHLFSDRFTVAEPDVVLLYWNVACSEVGVMTYA